MDVSQSMSVSPDDPASVSGSHRGASHPLPCTAAGRRAGDRQRAGLVLEADGAGEAGVSDERLWLHLVSTRGRCLSLLLVSLMSDGLHETLGNVTRGTGFIGRRSGAWIPRAVMILRPHEGLGATSLNTDAALYWRRFARGFRHLDI